MRNNQPKKNGLRTMKGMKPRQALDYFFTYYSLHFLIFVMAVLFLILLIRGSLNAERREAMLRGILIEAGFTAEGAAAGTDAFGDYLSLDPETQYVRFEATPGITGITVEGMQKVLTGVIAGEADVLVGDVEQTDYLLKSGAVSDLNTILSDEVLAQWAEAVYYVDTAALAAWGEAHRNGSEENPILTVPSPEGMTQAVPVALDVTAACETVFGRPAALGPVLLTVSVTTERQTDIAAFLAFLKQ